MLSGIDKQNKWRVTFFTSWFLYLVHTPNNNEPGEPYLHTRKLLVNFKASLLNSSRLSVICATTIHSTEGHIRS